MDNRLFRNLFVVTGVAIFIGTIVLNLMAIVYISSRREKTSIAILVVNLAVADMIHASRSNGISSAAAAACRTRLLFVSVGIIFFSSNLFTPSWVFGEFGCKFSLTIDVLCTVVNDVFFTFHDSVYK